MSLADAWESNASDWIAWARAPGHDGFWEGTWPALTQILPEPAGLVLDLGCGEGRCSRLLQASGRRVVGLDRSPTLVKAAKSGSPPVPVTLADAAALPFADDAFGLVVACMSLMETTTSTVRSGRPRACSGRTGVFCLAVVHPFDSAHGPPVPGGPRQLPGPYLRARRYEDHFERDGLGMTFVSVHRPVGAYVAALAGNGMVVTDLREHGDRDIPWILTIRAEKRGRVGG